MADSMKPEKNSKLRTSGRGKKSVLKIKRKEINFRVWGKNYGVMNERFLTQADADRQTGHRRGKK